MIKSKIILFSVLYLILVNYLFAQLNYEINNLNNSNKTKTSLPQKVDDYYWNENTNEWELRRSNNYTYNNNYQLVTNNIYNYSDWQSEKVVYMYNNQNLVERICNLVLYDYSNQFDTIYSHDFWYDSRGNDSIRILADYNSYPNIRNSELTWKYDNIYVNQNNIELIKERITSYKSKKLDSLRISGKRVFDYDSISNHCIQITYFLYDSFNKVFKTDRMDSDFSWYKWNGSTNNSIEKGHVYKYYKDSVITNFYKFYDEYDDKENIINYHVEFWDSDSNRWNLAAYTIGGKGYYTLKFSYKYVSEEVVERISQYFNKMDSVWVNYEKNIYYNFLPITSKEKEVIHVFPNPNNGFLNIETLNYNFTKMEIFDFTGKLIYTQNCADTQLKIDLNHLNNGIYIMNTQLENGQINKTKLVLSK